MFLMAFASVVQSILVPRKRLPSPPPPTISSSATEGILGRFLHPIIVFNGGLSANRVLNGFSPGRFLAVHEMKIIFAILLLKYDLKLALGASPQPWFIGTMAIPDTTLEVLFKAWRS